MIRRLGLLVGSVFAVGALLGIGASSMFLGIDAVDIRSSAVAQFPARSGPLAEMVLDTIEEDGVFERAAAEVRARQVRNLRVAAAVAIAVAAGLGMAFSRRVATVPTMPGPVASPRPNTRASSSPGRGGPQP